MLVFEKTERSTYCAQKYTMDSASVYVELSVYGLLCSVDDEWSGSRPTTLYTMQITSTRSHDLTISKTHGILTGQHHEHYQTWRLTDKVCGDRAVTPSPFQELSIDGCTTVLVNQQFKITGRLAHKTPVMGCGCLAGTLAIGNGHVHS